MNRRVAVVTGAARGIGAATVEALVKDGWDVVGSDIDDVDVRNFDVVLEWVLDVERRYGRVDAAVAAAGVVAGGAALWESPADDLDAMLDTNVKGVWNLAAAVVPALLRRPVPRSGRFVAIASAAAHRGLWHLSAYCASKHAVAGLVRGLAADLRGTGISAMAVSPGSTRTAMLDATAALYGLADPTELGSGHLIERLLEPTEVAEVIRWLCSPEASAMTGSVVHADGGLTV